MKRHPLRLAILTPILLGASAAAATTCESLAKLELPSTAISRAESVQASCRVSGVLQPTPSSHIEFEIRMPQSGWNGKLEGVGNGGFGGSIDQRQMTSAVTAGYAIVATDTGHHGGATDAGWALKQPEKIADFGYRAIHLTAVTAKAILSAFYGGPPKRSYFSSCSNGGRQALMEAQRYPEDYDGIIAGAPAYNWTHLLTNSVWDLLALLGDKASDITPNKLKAIQAAALEACDALDGVKDGVIEDPSRCHFDPAVLLCKAAETDDCLTAPQVAALKKLYAGGHTSSGERIFPGYSPGGEAEGGGWQPWITATPPERSLMFAFGTQFFKNMVFDDPAWDYRKFDVDRDLKSAEEKTAAALNAADPDLTRFRKRGGKLILYHGWSDAAIAAHSTIDYYENVQKKMGADQAREFVRLFMVPGMQHCGGGSGPSAFGQFGPPAGDADHDADAALERWVEKGVAPERIVASQKSPVARTRPLCAYPLTARYKGSGSTDDASNFTCSESR
jgi:hypothetical protein